MLAKLLSHRLRRFGAYEHSPSALDGACRSKIPYLEIDTRVTRDGEVYVYHDPVTGRELSQRRVLAETPAAEVARLRYRNGEPLLTLRDALARFRERELVSQRLCIDIKDFGFEKQHLQLVREFGLEDSVCWISWIPQTLLSLHELGTRAPLVLSHTNVHDARMLERLTSLHGGRITRIGRFVLLGDRYASSRLAGRAHGFQHTLVCRRLPEPLPAILAHSEGGICVHRVFAGRELSAYCVDHGLRLWVFSATRPDDFRRWAARPELDVVFCDDAPAVGRELLDRPLA